MVLPADHAASAAVSDCFGLASLPSFASLPAAEIQISPACAVQSPVEWQARPPPLGGGSPCPAAPPVPAVASCPALPAPAPPTAAASWPAAGALPAVPAPAFASAPAAPRPPTPAPAVARVPPEPPLGVVATAPPTAVTPATPDIAGDPCITPRSPPQPDHSRVKTSSIATRLASEQRITPHGTVIGALYSYRFARTSPKAG